MSGFSFRLWVGLSAIGALLLALVVPVTAASAAASSKKVTVPAASSKKVTVPATQPWTNTGISVPAGIVSFSASGTINVSSGDPAFDETPAGDGPADPQCIAGPNTPWGDNWIADGLPCWSLIGRIGKGAPFEIGDSAAQAVSSPGELYLGVDDQADMFGDNSGSWTVQASWTSGCTYTPVMFGLHGMGEGPSSTDPNLSPEISGVNNAQKLISGAVRMQFAPYPTVTPSVWDVLDTINRGPLTKAVQTGESNLQSYLAAWTKGCQVSREKIALVGYSMGAWVINKWLKDHPNEWSWVKVLVLYGDPCWSNGSDLGLARIFHATGCNPAQYYPAPGSSTSFHIFSDCLNLDPVCGAGYGDAGIAQLDAAAACTHKSTCAHLQYTNGAPSSGPLYNGAKFLVQALLGSGAHRPGGRILMRH
jgi:hypothetical protein